ncbi:chromosome segregation SMC family protein, partial [Peptoniphilus duerdenii]|uniref:chromosome segregation SMC family protein n=1 Tax=Peptoniphilus duerdenii TaxID=507750 RepID=UPI00288ABEB5
MYLKSLTMQGFKSFADKTKIEFDNEITGVVGPNGSGKSNISDAIMWVLGETSIKSLRGKKMEDVIFSGTNKRKPLGFAEVTILFNNIDRALNIDFDEVVVSRKMYRSLESEYRINGEKVRLKDVKELFMDTGIGKDGYSLIGQGRIDEVLSNSPDKRRAIFEEASGISKFKSKKQEALNKLNRTDQNITRISDIISEIATRVDELEEESKKAIKYLEFAGELKELDLTISKRDYSNIINYLKDRSTILKEKTSEFDKTNLNLEDFRNKEKIFKEDIEKLQIEL